MSQYNELDKALPGLKYGLDGKVATGAAQSAIAFGAPVFASKGEENRVGALVNDKATVAFDANFVTANVVAGTVTINGGTAVNYSVNFNTNHATTFAALVAALDAISGIEVVSFDATARTIVLSANGLLLAVTGAVTGGATQAAVTVTAGTDMVLRGVALRTAKILVNGLSRYEITDPVNILTDGEVWVNTADAVDAHKQAYLASGGAWTDEASGNTATPYTFRSSTTAAGLARLEVVSSVKALG